jgi:hypothetical protein
LKKEFSEENIDFWVKCENYKKLADADEMKRRSHEIWNTYLDTSSMHQINVDNKARSHCKEALQNPNNSMFEMAQTQVYTYARSIIGLFATHTHTLFSLIISQIFTLMKYDSYSRFLKSQMYKDCIVNEMEGKPLLSASKQPANNKVNKQTQQQQQQQQQLVNKSAQQLHNANTIPSNMSLLPSGSSFLSVSSSNVAAAAASGNLADSTASNSTSNPNVIPLSSNFAAQTGASVLSTVVVPHNANANGSSSSIITSNAAAANALYALNQASALMPSTNQQLPNNSLTTNSSGSLQSSNLMQQQQLSNNNSNTTSSNATSSTNLNNTNNNSTSTNSNVNNNNNNNNDSLSRKEKKRSTIIPWTKGN